MSQFIFLKRVTIKKSNKTTVKLPEETLYISGDKARKQNLFKGILFKLEISNKGVFLFGTHPLDKIKPVKNFDE